VVSLLSYFLPSFRGATLPGATHVYASYFSYGILFLLLGTSIRVYLVTLHGQGRVTTRQQKYNIHDNIRKSNIQTIVDFLAECVDSFLTFIGKGDIDTPMSLGFVVSFPLNQTALNKASIIRWTKDFDVTGADGKDFAELLQVGLNKKSIPVKVKAILNGAVGLLLAHNYRSLDTLLACTVSRGTNAAYWERVEDIPKIKGNPNAVGNEMIINTEWGSFGDIHHDFLPRTMYDNKVNRESTNPGVHQLEKMVSGLYLGEIVRNILLDLLDRRLIFNMQYSIDMNLPYNFEASYMSTIESDDSPDLEDTKHILETIMNIQTTTLTDRQMTKKICSLVGQRAARIIAAAMSAVIHKRNALETGLTISKYANLLATPLQRILNLTLSIFSGVEGTIYEHYPNFPNRVNEALREIFGEKVDRINIGVSRRFTNVHFDE
jgi:hexokinase